jgi:hypothetical protein
MNAKQKSSENETPSESYEALGVDQLVMYCVKRIIQNNEECTLERLIYECFTIFPKKFSLSRYPQWPDATRVYRSWRRCILDNKWLKGSPNEGFRMTREGELVADTIANKLKDPNLAKQKVKQMTRIRGKEEAITRYLRKSGAFNRWLQDRESFRVSESELRSVLNATLETPTETLIENMVYYRENADLIKDNEVTEFLDECYKQNQSILRRL